MQFFEDIYLNFYRKQRGLLLLLFILLLIQFTLWKLKNKNIDIKYSNSAYLQAEIDSLYNIEQKEKNKLKIYPFNPNYLTDVKAYKLGMSVEEINRLLSFRSQGKFINSALQFKQVTGVRSTLLDSIEPYFKFPDWVRQRQNSEKTNKKYKKYKVYDINLATAKDLQLIYGVGEKLSDRIINYRKKIQGFTYEEQLLEIYGLDSVIVERIKEKFKILSPPDIKKQKLQEITLQELIKIPYVDYDLASLLIFLRTQNDSLTVSMLYDFSTIDSLTIHKLNIYLQ